MWSPGPSDGAPIADPERNQVWRDGFIGLIDSPQGFLFPRKPLDIPQLAQNSKNVQFTHCIEPYNFIEKRDPVVRQYFKFLGKSNN